MTELAVHFVLVLSEARQNEQESWKQHKHEKTEAFYCLYLLHSEGLGFDLGVTKGEERRD